jgi:PIN domain nuclease of toxin-antitoxin system
LSDPANAVSWSAVCSWEIALKYEAGRLLLPTPAAGWVLATRSVLRAELLDVTEAHMLAAAALPRIHGDPFDRLLVAQARAERLVLLSLDDKVRAYDVEVWPPR